MIAMKKFAAALFVLLGLASAPALAQGVIGGLPLTQQFSFTNCIAFTNACGTPLIAGQLFTYQVGTVATVQLTFQDTGLTLPNAWPLTLDSNGRVPMFYVANGSVHVRLTDANGVVQFDVASALVVGPSSGGGGGGSVDPTTIASTGAYKWRATSEVFSDQGRASTQTNASAASDVTAQAHAR